MSWPEKGKLMKEPVGLQISFMWRSQSKCQRPEVYVMVGKGWQLPIVLSCDRNLLLSYVRDIVRIYHQAHRHQTNAA
ncbi:hypothetical protein IG631_18221 [Alternaria alternata]|nr:hypothetical protein IG631_18221 [Alternaria alternata]